MRRPTLFGPGLILALGLAGCDTPEPAPVAPPVTAAPEAPAPKGKGTRAQAPTEASPSINQAAP